MTDGMCPACDPYDDDAYIDVFEVESLPGREDLLLFCAEKAYDFTDNRMYPVPTVVHIVTILTKQAGFCKRQHECPVAPEAVGALMMWLRAKAVDKWPRIQYEAVDRVDRTLEEAAEMIAADCAASLGLWWRGSQRVCRFLPKTYPAEFRRARVDTVLDLHVNHIRYLVRRGLQRARRHRKKRLREETVQLWSEDVIETEGPDTVAWDGEEVEYSGRADF